MRAVNLLPRQQQVEQRRERPKTVVLVAGIGSAAVVLALVGGFLLANRSADRQQQALSTARSVLATTPAHHVSAQTNSFRSSILDVKEQRTLALASALGKRVAWDRILRRFAQIIPSDVWLTNLTGTVPLAPAVSTAGATTASSALPPTATALTIKGYTYSQAGVARLLERLQVVPDLKNVQLQDSETGNVSGVTVINFTIVSDIRNGRGAS